MKHVVILGCTGSIGLQALDIVSRFPDEFRLAGIAAAGNDPEKLAEIIHRFPVSHVVVIHKQCADYLLKTFSNQPSINIHFDETALCRLAGGELCETDIVLSGMSGTSGLKPSLSAIKHGKHIALANKETLVTGGELVMKMARDTGSCLFPVDSEHAAIHQCLKGLKPDDVRRLILTCSGGPFYSQPHFKPESITPAQALIHPTWKMGYKITVDSATLMNKGLEVIEAHWLFNTEVDCIDVLIHPQSVVHSLVETIDGSVLAQMSVPDMRLPILYALTGGAHRMTTLPRLDLTQVSGLTFFHPDVIRFPCLNLAYQAIRAGKTYPAVLNATNEIAVDAFVNEKIRFDQIPLMVDSALANHQPWQIKSVEDIVEANVWSKQFAEVMIGKLQ